MNAPSDSAASILVSCQQTRFHLIEDNASKEVDIKGLSITIAPEITDESTIPGARVKGKAKAKPEGLEILTNAELRLKTGVHYALVGRNGTGKSTLLRALAERLIPGIPLTTRIAILQQTAIAEEPSSSTIPSTFGKTVLQQVVEGDPHRNHLLDELDVITKAVEGSNDPLAPVRALRWLKHQRLQSELFEAQKTAKLRSGARGSEARKVLIAYEKKFEESTALLNQDEAVMDLDTIQKETKEAVDFQTDLQSLLETMQISDMEAKARHVLAGLGFKEPQLNKPFSALSGGWKMRCLLAAALTQSSDILILDEPTNYLDLLGILWLQHYLASLETTNPDTIVILVSHDREFVNSVCSETIILRDQALTYFGGNLHAYEKSIRHKTLQMTKLKDAHDRQTAHMEKTISHNMKQGKLKGDDSKVRQAKSRQKKLDDRMGMQVNAHGHRFKLNRDRGGYYLSGRDEIEIPKEEVGVTMEFPEVPDLRFPGSLVSLEKVSFSYRKSPKPTLQDIDFVVHSGDKIGILGLNGSGKSTLIHLLVEAARPSSGAVTKHPRLKTGYYSQHAVEALQETGRSEPALTALAMLLRHAASTEQDLSEPEARSLLGSMGLPGRLAAQTPVRKLSGGQLVRLELSKVLLQRPHLLVLDEPTTHLDLPTVSALTHAMTEFAGAIVLVSHDRFLIRCVVEGEPVDQDSSDDEGGGSAGAAGSEAGRRIVYELKAGKLTEKESGVGGWEEGLVGRLKKLGI